MSYKLEYGRHVVRRRRRRRRHRHAYTSNTASHFYHEKNDSWVSMSMELRRRSSPIKLIRTVIEDNRHKTICLQLKITTTLTKELKNMFFN